MFSRLYFCVAYFNKKNFTNAVFDLQCVGRSQRLKQARTEVQDEITEYKQQCDASCQKHIKEACIIDDNIIHVHVLFMRLVSYE